MRIQNAELGAGNVERIPNGWRELGEASQIVLLYFVAQHHGMPTRLLDWTTNPLAALFFAAKEFQDEDGEVIVMDPRKVIPDNISSSTEFQKEDLLQNVRTMRHPFIADVIGESFWHKPTAMTPKVRHFITEVLRVR